MNIGALEAKRVDSESPDCALSNRAVQRTPTVIPTPRKLDTNQQEQATQDEGPSHHIFYCQLQQQFYFFFMINHLFINLPTRPGFRYLAAEDLERSSVRDGC